MNEQNNILYTSLINEYDNKFYYENKQSKLYVFKGYVNRKIISNNISLNLKIRKYYDYKNHKSIYPVYDFLNIKKHKYDQNIVLNVVKKVLFFNNSYNSAGYINDDLHIPKSTIFKFVNDNFSEFSNQLYKQKIDNFKPLKDKIFICIDDTFKNLKVKNKTFKYRFRIINIYQNKVNNKFVNQIKICLIFKTNSNENSLNKTTKIILENLNKYY